MSTRIYLPSSGSAPVTPSTWNFPYQVGTTYTYAGVTAKISSTMTSRTSATGTVSGRRQGVVRYVIGPLSAVQISGTVKLVMRVSESASGANAQLALAVKIIQPDGSDRAVLLTADSSDSASAPYEMTTTLSVKYAYTEAEAYPMTLTAQTPTLGDYLVIEIGFRSATTISRSIVHRIGDNNANDCPESVGDTNDYCGWVEFSQTLPLIVYKTLAGTSAAAGDATGVSKRIRRILGTSAASVSATASLLVPKKVALVGTSACISGFDGSLKRQRELQALIEAQSSATGILKKDKTLSGTSSATSSVSGDIKRERRVMGDSSCQSGCDGNLTVTSKSYKTLAGTAACTSGIGQWRY